MPSLLAAMQGVTGQEVVHELIYYGENYAISTNQYGCKYGP